MAGTVTVPSQKKSPEETLSHQQNLFNSSGAYDSLTVPFHPLKIKPAGNAYTATENIKLAAGSFALLPDELLIQVLEYLGAASLKRLGSACKALYAFSRLEDLWKTLCIEYELPLSNVLAIPLSHLHLELLRWDLDSSSRRLAVQVEAMELLVSGQSTYHNINAFLEHLLPARHLHIRTLLSVSCTSSTLKDKHMLRGHFLGLSLPLLRGVERGALPTSTCPKPIVPKSPARTYSPMSFTAPSSALILRCFLTRVTYRFAMLFHG